MYKNFLYDGVEFKIYDSMLLIKLLRSGDQINGIFSVQIQKVNQNKYYFSF